MIEVLIAIAVIATVAVVFLGLGLGAAASFGDDIYTRALGDRDVDRAAREAVRDALAARAANERTLSLAGYRESPAYRSGAGGTFGAGAPSSNENAPAARTRPGAETRR